MRRRHLPTRRRRHTCSKEPPAKAQKTFGAAVSPAPRIAKRKINRPAPAFSREEEAFINAPPLGGDVCRQ